MHRKRIRNRLESDFCWSVNFYAEKQGAPFLRLEDARFFSNDVEDGVVAHALVHERYVHGSWQLLIDVQQLLHQEGSLVLQSDQTVRNLTQALDKVWCRKIAIVDRLVNFLLLQCALLLCTNKLFLLFQGLRDVVPPACVDLLIGESVLVRW